MRYWRHGLVVIAGVVVAALSGVALYVVSLGPVPRGDRLDYSHVVLDREGRLLRAYADRDGRWRLPVTVDEVDPRFVDILLSYEDRRFYSHPGVDVFALGRAAVQLIAHREIVTQDEDDVGFPRLSAEADQSEQSEPGNQATTENIHDREGDTRYR
jgi:penicillin-binding protein 1C